MESDGRDEPALPVEKGVVFGTIGMYQGNCMPSPDGAPCEARGQRATIYITEPAYTYAENLLVSSAETDEGGYFELELEPGNYSLFVYDNLPEWETWNECGERTACDEGGAYRCDVWQGDVCKPFTVVAGGRTEVNADIDHAAW